MKSMFKLIGEWPYVHGKDKWFECELDIEHLDKLQSSKDQLKKIIIIPGNGGCGSDIRSTNW